MVTERYRPVFQYENKMSRTIKWKIHFNAQPKEVYHFLDTQEGREKYWAESAPVVDGCIEFVFANGQQYKSKVLSRVPSSYFQVEYFESIVQFNLKEDGNGGTDLTLLNSQVSEEEYDEIHAGWVSLLMTMKAAIDFQIDLRNHDPGRTWDQGFVDN